MERRGTTRGKEKEQGKGAKTMRKRRQRQGQKRKREMQGGTHAAEVALGLCHFIGSGVAARLELAVGVADLHHQ
jgi:hypothetical protein